MPKLYDDEATEALAGVLADQRQELIAGTHDLAAFQAAHPGYAGELARRAAAFRPATTWEEAVMGSLMTLERTAYWLEVDEAEASAMMAAAGHRTPAEVLAGAAT